MTPLYLSDHIGVPPCAASFAELIRPVFRQPENGVYLRADAEGIALCKAGEKGRVRADFTEGVAQHRRLQGGGELIGKAVNHAAKPLVWDATGGLGRDAFVLATLGLSVCVYERHPAVYCLLYDGLERARACADTAVIAARISLRFGDAVKEMQRACTSGEPRPDVVYLDPMYPERRKSAAVKKEMAYFHELVGADSVNDDGSLLRAARSVSAKRIVVKRPRLGEFLDDAVPAYQYTGKSTRFDVYLPFQAASAVE